MQRDDGIQSGESEDLEDARPAHDDVQVTIDLTDVLEGGDEDAEAGRVDEGDVGQVDYHPGTGNRCDGVELGLEGRCGVRIQLPGDADDRAPVQLA